MTFKGGGTFWERAPTLVITLKKSLHADRNYSAADHYFYDVVSDEIERVPAGNGSSVSRDYF